MHCLRSPKLSHNDAWKSAAIEGLQRNYGWEQGSLLSWKSFYRVRPDYPFQEQCGAIVCAPAVEQAHKLTAMCTKDAGLSPLIASLLFTLIHKYTPKPNKKETVLDDVLEFVVICTFSWREIFIHFLPIS